MSDTLTTAVRTVDDKQIPIAGRYQLDSAHSEVGFKVRHLGVGKVRGRFADFDATIVVADDPVDSSVEAHIETASIDTRDDDRDGHLRSEDFLAVESHPTMTFRSIGVSSITRDGSFTIEGELTIRDTTRPVTLEATMEGALVDPWDNARFGFAATAEIDREDFGLTWNQVLETGGLLVGKKVTIEIEGEAVLQQS